MDFTAVMGALARIEDKIGQLLTGPKPETLTAKEVMVLTGDKSQGSFFRTCVALGIRPFKRNCYRRVDVTNAIARRALKELQAQQRDARIEAQKEGRVRTKQISPSE